MTQNSNISSPPDSNLVWGILCTIFCCLPFGIISIIKSSKVSTLWMQGDTDGAIKASKDARKYAIWGAIIGPLLGIIVWVLALVFGFANAIIN